MAPDDFDKIDDDDDFASEFDFVEEDSAKGAAPGGSSTPSSKPPGSGKPPSPLLKGLLILITVVGLGFFGYTHFMGSSSKTAQLAHQAAANPQHPAPGNTPSGAEQATAHEHSTPLPEPSHPDMAQQNMPTSLQPADQNSVDFSEAFSKAESSINTSKSPQVTPPSHAQNPTGAVPTKTFEQVQKDLQNKQTPGQSVQTAAIPTSVSTTLDTLSEEMTMNVNQIKQLETTIVSLATTVDQLNRTISAMDNRILSLTEVADNLAQDLNNVKKVMVAEDLDLTNPGTLKYTPKKQVQAVSSTISYTVHAIIPGRAWLKSSSGQIITVTEGDKLGDFGTIAVIDATNGVVRTSSGITFR